MNNIVFCSRKEVVEAHYVMPVIQKTLAEVRAKKACSPRDQDALS
jgi:hypothetical protein